MILKNKFKKVHYAQRKNNVNGGLLKRNQKNIKKCFVLGVE